MRAGTNLLGQERTQTDDLSRGNSELIHWSDEVFSLYKSKSCGRFGLMLQMVLAAILGENSKALVVESMVLLHAIEDAVPAFQNAFRQFSQGLLGFPNRSNCV